MGSEFLTNISVVLCYWLTWITVHWSWGRNEGSRTVGILQVWNYHIPLEYSNLSFSCKCLHLSITIRGAKIWHRRGTCSREWLELSWAKHGMWLTMNHLLSYMIGMGHANSTRKHAHLWLAIERNEKEESKIDRWK